MYFLLESLQKRVIQICAISGIIIIITEDVIERLYSKVETAKLTPVCHKTWRVESLTKRIQFKSGPTLAAQWQWKQILWCLSSLWFLFCPLVKLNGGRHVQGILRGFDPFMNLVVDDTLEMGPGGQQNTIGMVVSTSYLLHVNLHLCHWICWH